MSLHPELIDFQRRLEAVGVIAAVHADHVCVRLPLLTSVRVRYDGARLAFEPRFGAASRVVATMATYFAASGAVLALAVTGTALPYVVSIGVLGTLAGVYDAMRYVVTESAVTRVALLWSAFRGTEPATGALGSGPARTVHPGGAGETIRPPLHVE